MTPTVPPNAEYADANAVDPRTAGTGPQCTDAAPAGPPGPSADPAAVSLARVDLHGVAFDRLSEAQTVGRVLDAVSVGRGGWVITSNLDHLARAATDADFRRMLDEADLVVADGAPLVWASRLQGTPLPERVAGSTLAWSLSAAAAARGASLFLLGGDAGVAEKAAATLTDRYPGLRIAGTFFPPMGFEKDAAVMDAMRATLRESRPDLVYVALGSPKQERLIRQLRSELGHELRQTWWLGLGISLSFICGDVRRAPVWMQRVGLEWLHRMGQEPRRLAKRYLVTGVPFAMRLLSCAVVRRWRGPASGTGDTPPGDARRHDCGGGDGAGEKAGLK